MYLSLIESVIKNVAVLGMGAYLTTQLPPFRRALNQSEYRLKDKIVLIFTFGLFSGIGNYLSMPVLDSLANTRIIGAVAGGLLGGPVVGLGAGIIGGIARYFMGGFTMMPAIASNIIAGVLSGLVYAKYGARKIGVKQALVVTFIAEIILKTMVIAFSVPREAAWELEKVIAIPTIIANCLGVAFFVYIVRDVYLEQEKIQAQFAHKAMRVIRQTHGVFWQGLNEISAGRVAGIIYSELDTGAVAVTDKEKILAFIGQGSDHHIVGQECITGGTRQAMRSKGTVIINNKEDIGCPVPKCPLAAVIITPLIVDNGFIGSIKVYKTGKGVVLPHEAELVQGIADFLSLQLLHGELEAKNTLLAQAEYNSLRAQIHPHFIFNALSTIGATIRTEPGKAKALIKDLSYTIRRHVRPSAETCTILEEIEFVDSYIRIEQARFGERIQIIKIIEPEVYFQHIPVFSVQVLVENAVKHGLTPKKDGGSIEIKAVQDKQGGFVHISVADTGVGIAGERLKTLTGINSSSPIDSGVGIGIGLSNVHARIQSLFGKEYGLLIKSVENEGTCVSFRIPTISGKGADDL